MKILFIHQNFPGQFKFLGPALAARGHDVHAMTMRADAPSDYNGVTLHPYKNARGSTPNIHPWAQDFETKIIRAEACYEACRKLSDGGFEPDVIIAHHGWGESLLLKHVWPKARLGIYCEFYYKAEGGDVGFDPEFPVDLNAIRNNLLFKNLNNDMHFKFADAGISPTHWQASTFPEEFRSKISVVHDGIDTLDLAPDEGVKLSFEDGRVFTKADKIITFVNRHIEPYRGCHTFFRALPDILSKHRDAHVFIIGAEGVSYGAKPQGEKSWKQIFWDDEVAPKLEAQQHARVHFLGRVDYGSFKKILALSSAHVYLTYPFVLSWSLLEAMSIGCPIVASNTPPVAEVIKDQENGYLFDFFSPAALSNALDRLLADEAARVAMSRSGRQFVQENFDLQNVCLPKQISWVEGIMENT